MAHYMEVPSEQTEQREIPEDEVLAGELQHRAEAAAKQAAIYGVAHERCDRIARVLYAAVRELRGNSAATNEIKEYR